MTELQRLSLLCVEQYEKLANIYDAIYNMEEVADFRDYENKRNKLASQMLTEFEKFNQSCSELAEAVDNISCDNAKIIVERIDDIYRDSYAINFAKQIYSQEILYDFCY